MAAYAALNSLKHIIDQLQQHPFPPISLHKQQAQSLTANLNFLQEFLHCYNSPVGDSELEADPLLSGIADAAYAAEDVLESYIADKIASGNQDEEQVSLVDLQKVIEEMDSIKKLAIKAEMAAVQYQVASESGSASTVENRIMVGFDDVLIETMDMLKAERFDLKVIPIVGMGGMGKTTLARNVYVHPLIKNYFGFHAWATISQQYNTKEILCNILCQSYKDESKERLRGMSEYELGVELYQYLFGRRFFIVMDDMWSIEAWNDIKSFIPNNGNGSRILVTTRQSDVGSQLNNEPGPQIRFLDEFSSWDLFSQSVFGEEGCPPELRGIAKDIVRNCKGLPLSIVVVAGLLNRLEHTPECWGSIKNNLSSAVNLDNDKQCLNVLKMSYNYLQAHLKPCFLYMGIFEEFSVIRVSSLIKLWACEGLLKPESGKSFKTIGEEYLKQLVDGNLVLVDELGSIGNIKCCKIHDLLRDLCLREAERERFYHVITQDSPQEIGSQRRIVIPRSTSKKKVIHALRSSSHARSIICDENTEFQLSSNFRLLRVFQTFDRTRLLNYEHSVKDAFEFGNLRYLGVGASPMFKLPSSIKLLWDLQTLIFDDPELVSAPVEIWKMIQLRHVQFSSGGLYLPDPPPSGDVKMENLHTLLGVRNLKLNEEVIRRIPNIVKLGLDYYKANEIESYCLNNLERLHKLESFICKDCFRRDTCLANLNFPCSLKKLALNSWNVDWGDVLDKIGCLPLLQKLKLRRGFFRTGRWEIVEGQFPRLKFLLLELCVGLEYWTAEGSIFPRLETLQLHRIIKLKEMCSEIGDIPTLQLINLAFCDGSTVECAKQIVEEQEEFQGEELGFQVRVIVGKNWESLQKLASSNFKVEVQKYN